jgi:hypothetical protein
MIMAFGQKNPRRPKLSKTANRGLTRDFPNCPMTIQRLRPRLSNRPTPIDEIYGWTKSGFMDVGPVVEQRQRGGDMHKDARVATDRLTIALLNLASQGQRVHCSDPVTHSYWLSEHPAERALAALACRGCPVFVECGEAAAANDERWGVWNAVDRSVRIVIRCSGYWASAGGPCEEDSDSWCRDWRCGLRVIPAPDSRGSEGEAWKTTP